MNYKETLEYIHSVNNYFCKPGLERIKELCSFLDNPQDKLKFVHVAGTNGKGSFCAMLGSILKDAGYKVGTYTSPYILEFNERICINGEMISNEDLAEICTYIKPFADKMVDRPTEFELITAIGFEYFYRKGCDIVVLECGLGGRYDATNLINSPLLSVITGVDFDHQNFLGDTIKAIAIEKAGIIKENTPVLWCGDKKDAEKVMLTTAAALNCKVYAPEHNSLKILSTDLNGTTFDYKEYKDLSINLLGGFQPYNAANAVTAAEILRENEFSITDANIRTGLKNTRWRARFELLNKSPVIIFDGSHNPQGVLAAVNSIKQYFGNQRVNILTGVMRDKDYRHIAKEISRVAKCIHCITPNNPRSLSADEYCDIFKALNIPSFAYNSIQSAFLSAVKDSDTPLICMGSLYMYSDIYKLINS